MRHWWILAGLLAVAPVIGQEESETYFALTSNKTFSPGDSPRINLWAQGVRSLDFRLYRVENASEFLGQLNDAHSFGNQTAQLPKEDTLLLKLSRWKRRWRTQGQLFVRQQFTSAARAEWRASRGSREAAPVVRKTTEKGTAYAEIPVLNEKQLIRSWKENITSKQSWEEQAVEIPVKEAGLYLVEATDGKLRAYTLLSVSNMAVLTKSKSGDTLIRVVDRGSGKALAGIDLEVRSQKTKHGTFKTDPQGFARWKGTDTSDVFVVAVRDRDVAFDSLSEYTISPNEERRMAVYAYTERPVYRPGHKVHYKAVVRKSGVAGYELPQFNWVNAEISDGEGKAVHREELKVSAFGSVKSEFDLPLTSALGYYSIKFSAGQMESYASFQVEEYKKPEYEVKIRPSRPRVVQGERVEAIVAAKYFFGEPVKGAKVSYTVRRAPYYPPWYERDELSYQQTEEDESGGSFFRGEQGEEKTARLNDQGELSIQLPTPVAERDYLFRIEARVMDEGNREVSGYGMVIATRGTYMATLNPERYVVSPGQMANFTVVLKDYDSQPVAAEWRAELRQVEWRKEGRKESAVLETASGRTGVDGQDKLGLRVGGGGSYIVRVYSRTPEGRDVRDEEYVWVTGAGSLYGSEETSLKLIPDKKSYAAGETAKVLILTQAADVDLWVTTEGRSVIDSRALTAADAGGVTVEIPVRGEYQPKVFVTAGYIKEGKLHYGTVALKVPPVDKELKVQLTSAKAEFKPGEPARYSVEVKDSSGQPVKAELSLGVVDEALYAVKRDLTQTPLSFFYGNAYNEVESSNSLSFYFRGEAGKRAMRLARIRPSLGQLKPDQVGDPRVRKAFPDTAFWTADLVTDEKGRGQVEFAFPDALTMWRGTARAVTADTKVGAAMHRVIVRKNLMLRTVAPRFLMEGDEVSLGVIAQNYLGSAKDVKISLTGTGLEMLNGNERTVRVESKDSVKAEFRVRVKPGLESVITVKGLTDEESDAMELTLPVKAYGTLLTKGSSGAITNGQSANATLEAPGVGRKSIEVRVSPSLAGSLFGALEYLTSFPYGCTEQTMSSFLPNVTVTRALTELGISSRLRREDLYKKVEAGLERLYDYQHEDGAWGWWKEDASHPFMTAHVVSGMKQARAAGYPVSNEVLQRGEQWLRQEFLRQSDARADLRAYLAYALGTKADLDSVYTQRGKMTSYGLAFLGLGLAAISDPRADEVSQLVERAVQQNESEAWWPGTRDPLLDFENDITPETTAHVVKLLTRTRADSPLLPKASMWLVRHRDQGEWWNSTKQTAMVIYGLTDYLKQSGDLNPDLKVTVKVNGKVVLERDFGPADATRLTDVVARVEASDKNSIEVKVSGKGKLYWNAQASYYTRAEELGKGRSVKREYFRLVPRENAGTTTYALEALSGEIRPGDTIATLLTVNAPDLSYVLIEDAIPAGMELVTNDNTINLTGRPMWWRYSWARREYRDDRVAFFRTYFSKEESQYFYVMKAVNPGRFRVPPTRVQPMYRPEELTTGKAAVIEVMP